MYRLLRRVKISKFLNTWSKWYSIPILHLQLRVLCNADDSDVGLSNELYDYEIRTYSWITTMVLDGYTFRRNPSWLQQHNMLKSLTVFHLFHGTTDHAKGILDVQRALQTVVHMATPTWVGRPTLRYLKFRDINFSSSDQWPRYSPLFWALGGQAYNT